MNAEEPIKPSEDGIIRLVFKTFTYAPEFQPNMNVPPEAETESCPWINEPLDGPSDPEPPKNSPDPERDR